MNIQHYREGLATHNFGHSGCEPCVNCGATREEVEDNLRPLRCPGLLTDPKECVEWWKRFAAAQLRWFSYVADRIVTEVVERKR